MPRRKAKPTVDLVSRLEALSKDETLPLAVREDAGKELLRLTLKDNPAPAPAPVPAAAPYTESEIKEAFRQIEVETKSMPKTPPANTASESQEFAHEQEIKNRERGPEPAPRVQGSHWTIGGQDHIYLSFDAASQMHILSPVKPTGILPETIRVSEERLVGRRYAAPPRRGNCETVEEFRRRRDFEQAREASRWRQQMGIGVFSGDPPGC
jgi:hypothetical protein